MAFGLSASPVQGGCKTLFLNPRLPVGDAPVSVAVGDFDGDGSVDLAVANLGSNDVSVLLNRGDGTFGAAVTYPAGNSPSSVAVADLDGVNGLDLVVANAIEFDGNGDWIELLNTTDATIDISGWYLSDSSNNLRKFRIPDGTLIPAGGFVTFDQFGAGGFGDDPVDRPGAFGLSELGDTLRLSSVDENDIRENIDAAHVLPSGNIILSTTGTAMLGSNAFSFRNGDLVEYDPDTGVVELFFSERSFIGGAENIDAVSVLANGHLVLSTAGPAMLPAAGGTTLSFGNGDLVEWDPLSKTASLVFSELLFDAESGQRVANAWRLDVKTGDLYRCFATGGTYGAICRPARMIGHGDSKPDDHGGPGRNSASLPAGGERTAWRR